jgi:hypothetical protein
LARVATGGVQAPTKRGMATHRATYLEKPRAGRMPRRLPQRSVQTGGFLPRVVQRLLLVSMIALQSGVSQTRD